MLYFILMICYLLFYLFHVYVRILKFMLEYFKFISLIVFLTVFSFFVFQFQLTHKIIGVSHRKKLRLSNLIVSLSGEASDWSWGPVNDSGLAHSLRLCTTTSVMGGMEIAFLYEQFLLPPTQKLNSLVVTWPCLW